MTMPEALFNANVSSIGGAPIAHPCAEVAQLVEHVTENHGVGGSIPSLGTTFL